MKIKRTVCIVLLIFLLLGQFNCFALDIDTINSLIDSKYLILVNRQNKVSSDYVPSDLVTYSGSNYKLEKKCAAALKEMIDACKSNGGERLVLYSGYRTYQTQYNKYYNKINQYISQGYSKEQATKMTDSYYAPPGCSEHHTGLAADICIPSIVNKYGQLHEAFASTTEGKWLKQNSWRYGFILRYEKGKESITGYNYEPWHFRYVGKTVAKEIYDSKQTFEEYISTLKTAQNKLANPPKLTVENNKVSCRAPAGVTLRYTDNATTPTGTSKVYSSPFTATNKTYKIMGFYKGHQSNVATVTITPYGDVFKDVTVKDWFYQAVSEAVHKNAFSGMGDYYFAPNDTMSRAMMVQVLANINGVNLESYKGKSAYSDVKTNAWYTPAVNWAAKTGVVNGYGDGIFAPNDNITREQVCTIFYNYSNTKKQYVLKADTFIDQSSISDWAIQGIAYCYNKKIVNGYPDKTFLPRKTATRAEVAKITINYIEL